MPWLAMGTTYSLGKLPLSPSSSPYNHPARQRGTGAHEDTLTHAYIHRISLTFVLSLFG